MVKISKTNSFGSIVTAALGLDHEPIPTHNLMKMDSRELEARKEEIESKLEALGPNEERDPEARELSGALWNEWLTIQWRLGRSDDLAERAPEK